MRAIFELGKRECGKQEWNNTEIFPKKTDFAEVGNDKIKEVERWINNRPMKCLGYQTPAEVFNGFVALAT